jgi:hypothetical protein
MKWSVRDHRKISGLEHISRRLASACREYLVSTSLLSTVRKPSGTMEISHLSKSWTQYYDTKLLTGSHTFPAPEDL